MGSKCRWCRLVVYVGSAVFSEEVLYRCNLKGTVLDNRKHMFLLPVERNGFRVRSRRAIEWVFRWR